MTEPRPTRPPIGDQAFRKDDPYGRWPEQTYGGALSFLRRRYDATAQGAHVAVTGIPYDGATSYRPGSRLGPRAIRAASVQLAELPAFPFGFDPFDHLAVVDAGDCPLDPHHPETLITDIEAHIARLMAVGASPLVLGGDHFVTYPVLRAVAAVHGPVALLHFDAHSDTWEDDGSTLNHGTMFRRAANEGLVDPARSLQIGIRTHNDQDHGFQILTAPWVHRHGPQATIDAIHQRVAEGRVYLSFDIDCLDPAFAPGTGTPVVGGLSSAQALEIVRSLAGLDFVGMDVVEVAPAYDVSEITALAAATIAHDYLCLLAERRGARRQSTGL